MLTSHCFRREQSHEGFNRAAALAKRRIAPRLTELGFLKESTSGIRYAAHCVESGREIRRSAPRRRLGFFEIVGSEVMLLEQIVKVGAILAGQFSGVTDVAFGER